MCENAAVYLLCWISCLFFGFGANTVNAFWLSHTHKINRKMSVIKNNYLSAQNNVSTGTVLPVDFRQRMRICFWHWSFLRWIFWRFWPRWSLGRFRLYCFISSLRCFGFVFGLMGASWAAWCPVFAVTDISGPDCRCGFSCAGFLVQMLRCRCYRFRLYKSRVRHICNGRLTMKHLTLTDLQSPLFHWWNLMHRF